MGWAALIPLAIGAIQMMTEKPPPPPGAPQLGGQGGGAGGYQPTAANAPSGSAGPPTSARGAEDMSMAALGGGTAPPPVSARGAEDMSMQRFAQAMPQAGPAPQAGQAAGQMPKVDTSPSTMTPSADTMGQMNNYLQMGMMARDLMSSNTPAPPPPQLNMDGGGYAYNPTARRFSQAMR